MVKVEAIYPSVARNRDYRPVPDVRNRRNIGGYYYY